MVPVSDISSWMTGLIFSNFARALFTVAALLTTSRIYKTIKKKRRRNVWASVESGVVVLHQFPRSKTCPNISPFAIKVETFLRRNKIAYQTDVSEPFGPLGKCPWITLDGQEIADSDVILRHLSERFDIAMDADLSATDRTVSRAVRVMLEERTVVGIFYKRYTLDRMRHVWDLFPRWCRQYAPYIKHSMIIGMRVGAYFHGIGLFDEPRVMQLIRDDLLAVSSYLADKAYLMGDEMREVDCALFGMTVQLLHASGPQLDAMVREQCPNLVQHYQRIRNLHWKDWDQCLEPIE